MGKAASERTHGKETKSLNDRLSPAQIRANKVSKTKFRAVEIKKRNLEKQELIAKARKERGDKGQVELLDKMFGVGLGAKKERLKIKERN